MCDNATRQAGAEITDEMIEAGVQALWNDTTLAEFPNPADRLDIKKIVEAALRVREAD